MYFNQIKEATRIIEEKLTMKPEIGLILGSGLGVLADQIENPIIISYEDIPHFPQSTVEGHAGQFVFGYLQGKKVVAMQGRIHYYEGYTMKEVTFPVRVMKQLGINALIVTNAAGGINKQYNPGDLMLITDHINNMGDHPLIGKNIDALGERFPDMSTCYDKELIQLAEKSAGELNLSIQKGVYVANSGPAYETPAEVNMLRLIGGDAVGMSTAPEVIAARHGGLKVLGISCISNMAAGILDKPLSHEEVIDTTNRIKDDFLKLIQKIIKSL